eukprot:TRINITY_DN16258_c0_g2_i2.p1 TRINITY_DN16258_c0_g2~~TRINITY_DN16258_c0_g2_i2.p1  ORF type:complete len:850 (-),score=223.39 TRINITY_DN16258_c0_g2_i2:122-2671(-)
MCIRDRNDTLKVNSKAEKKFSGMKKNLKHDIGSKELKGVANLELQNYLNKHCENEFNTISELKDTPKIESTPNECNKEYSLVNINKGNMSINISSNDSGISGDLKAKVVNEIRLDNAAGGKDCGKLIAREVKELARENGVRSREVRELKEKNKELVDRHQAEIKSYNDCISSFIKEKYELQYRISYLENSLEAVNETLRATSSELEHVQEKNKREAAVKESEMRTKVLEYENTIRELKLTATSSVKRIEMTFNMQEYTNKLVELESKYVGQIKEVQGKLVESEKKRTETAAELRKAKASEQTMQEKVKKLEQTKKMLEDTNAHYQNLLRDANKKVADTEKKQVESEQKISIQLGYLNQANIELTSNVEQLRWKLEQTKDTESLLKAKDEEIRQLRTLNEDLERRIEGSVRALKSELSAKRQMWESEKQSLKKLVETTRGELEEAKGKLCKIQNELLVKSRIEEEALEVSKIANSLEAIINEYRSSNETLTHENLECKEELAKAREKISELVVSYSELAELNKTREEQVKKLTDDLNVSKQREKDSGVKLKVAQAEVESLKAKLREEYKKAIESPAKEYDSKIPHEAYENHQQLCYNEKNKNEEVEVPQIEKGMKDHNVQNDKVQEESNTQSSQPKEEAPSTNQTDTAQKELPQKNTLAERKQSTEETSKPFISYAPEKSDRIDQMIASYMNSSRCPVKLKRIAEGQYMFGTRKIFAKIQNDKLVIRIGGGYTMIEDFLATYTAPELNKLKKSLFNETEIFNSIAGEEKNRESGGLSRKRSEEQLAVGREKSSRAGRSKSPLVKLAAGTSRSRILAEQTAGNLKTARIAAVKKELKGCDERLETENVKIN